MISGAIAGPWPASKARIRVAARKKIAARVLGIVAALFRLRNRLGRSKRPPNTAIVLEPYGMGDVISLVPLLTALKNSGWRVAVLAKPSWKPLVPSELFGKWVSANLPWSSYRDGEKYSSPKHLFSVAGGIRQELREFEGCVGIDPRGDMRSVLLLQWLGCRNVISLDRYLGSDAAVPGFSATVVATNDGEHRWRQALGLLSPLGIQVPEDPLPPQLPRRNNVPAKRAKSVGFLPVAPWSGKEWLPGRWRDLRAFLLEMGWGTVGFCGPGQKASAEEILGQGIPLRECLTIQDWVGRLEEVGLLVTVDSGPMHLADALGIPTVSLFGASPLPLWAPSNRNAKVVHHQQREGFFPCQQVEANAGFGRFCMEKISTDEVFLACQQVVDSLA